jgi:hypothetical protein
MLWRKLTRAMLVIGREQTISTAAHEADFSDAAHLTRTFYQNGWPGAVTVDAGQVFRDCAAFRNPRELLAEATAGSFTMRLSRLPVEVQS